MKIIKPIQSLRFIAIFLIFLHHLTFLSDIPITQKLYSNIFSYFYIGVSFFFILSGYILTLKYASAFKKKKNEILSFYRKRLTRIYPLHLLTLFIAIPVVASSLNFFPGKIFIANLFLLQGFIPKPEYYFSFNNISWAISNLLFFYLLFPFWIILAKKLLRKKIMNYLYSALILIIYSLIYVIFIGDNFNLHWAYYISPFYRVIEFLAGSIVALFHLNFVRERRILKKWINHSLVEIIVLSLLVFMFIMLQFVPVKIRYGIFPLPFFSLTLILFTNSRGIITKALSSKYLVNLGNISYSFYMFHWLVIKYWKEFLPKITLSYPLVSSIGMFLATLVLSWGIKKKWTREVSNP